MRTRSIQWLVPLLVILSAPLLAQGVTQSSQPSPFAFAADRLTLDAGYTRVWMQNTTEGAVHPLHAATGRLSWRLGQPAVTEDAPLADKLAVGVFWTKAPEQDLRTGRAGFSHVGAFAEYMPIGVIALGYLEPNLSLGVGSFRRNVVQRVATPPALLLNDRDSTSTNLGILPAAGTRIWFNRNLGLRLDVHDLIVPSRKTWSNDFGLSAGLSARF